MPHDRALAGLSTISNILLLILLLLSPFLSSGDWSWNLGWRFTGAMILGAVASRMIANRLHPGLERERLTAGSMKDTKGWDKWIMPVISLWLPISAVTIAGLDERLGWSTALPAWAHWLGLALIGMGYAIGTWAMVVNAFFSSYVRIQKDRGHKVVTTGPYAIVRHPGYLGSALAMVGIPLLLDSLWAFLPVILILILGAVRTELEDRTLHAELPGYGVYSAKVRYRLVPGIW
jgi:protein-S-isoprenylcysteine O-methyltransferase Ste14